MVAMRMYARPPIAALTNRWSWATPRRTITGLVPCSHNMVKA